VENKRLAVADVSGRVANSHMQEEHRYKG